MIYLIDDKKLRQSEDFDWSPEKLAKYSDYIQPIYTLAELESNAEKIFKSNNVVLYHESFLDNTTLNKESVFKRIKLEQFAQSHQDFKLVIFSGSKNSRSIIGNIAHLPVSILYNNLEVFAKQCLSSDINVEFLAFGDNPKIESELLEKLENSLALIESNPATIDDQTCLFIPTSEKYIQDPIKDATILEFYDPESDSEITEFVLENLSQAKFDIIFLPLCYGNSLSDFNGLRLATHIRCTESPNQLSRIFIYGFVGLDYLMQSEFFNILKTKNVTLVPFSKKAFGEYANTSHSPLPIEELPSQIAKLKLDVPLDYEDSHSIANEWAIERWAESVRAIDGTTGKLSKNISKRLYFKFLKTIYPKLAIPILSEKDLKIDFTGNPKILYIDDEAEKGWYDIFKKILKDINGLDFKHLDEEFNSKNQKEVKEISVKKVIDEDIDLVILDFRLHPNDFNTHKISEVSGYRILKELKTRNPGIQVIIFSATNKIWNLEALQKEGSDGFIVKESPGFSTNEKLARQSMVGICELIGECLRMRFLKDAHKCLDSIESHVKSISNASNEQGFMKLLKLKFKNELQIQRKLIFDCLKNARMKSSDEFEKKQSYLNLSFISIYKIIELINDHYTSEDGRNLKISGNQVMKFDKALNTFNKIQSGIFPTAVDKFCSIIHHELALDVKQYFDKMILFNSQRKNIIHPNNLSKYYKSTESDNISFLKFIDEIICKMK